MVALVHPRYKVQPSLLGGHCNTQRCVGLPGCHRMRHGRVRGFGALVAVDQGVRNVGARQQLVQNHPGPSAQSPVGKAGLAAYQVGQALQTQRVATVHHQALGTLGKADDLVLPGL